MLTMKTWLMAAIMTVCASAAYAGAAGGTVVSINVIDANGLVLIRVSGTNASPPGCANQHTSSFVADLDTPAGRGMLSVALAAKASNVSITINGSGGCSRLTGYEDAVQLII
jgi:hypothetical protein